MIREALELAGEVTAAAIVICSIASIIIICLLATGNLP